MDELDHKILKDHLKPLVRRKQVNADRKALLKALGKLEERALGEHLLGQLRSYLKSKGEKKSKRFGKDYAEVKEDVAITKILYASRTISREEYVFYTLLPVEDYHWANDYDELKPINKQLKKIRKKHGFGPDEDWNVGEGPEEYKKLNKQWDGIFDSKFLKLLRDLELNDLADLQEKDAKRLYQLRERGRRTLHHNNEPVPAIRDIVVRYEEDARRAASVNAYSAAVISLGAAIEGLLILRCLKSPMKASRIAGRLRNRIRPGRKLRNDPTSWFLETLIEVCYEAGWLPPFETDTIRLDSRGMAHIIRGLRNHVHPGRYFRERPWSEMDQRDFSDTEAIYTVLLKTLGKPSRKK